MRNLINIVESTLYELFRPEDIASSGIKKLRGSYKFTVGDLNYEVVVKPAVGFNINEVVFHISKAQRKDMGISNAQTYAPTQTGNEMTVLKKVVDCVWDYLTTDGPKGIVIAGNINDGHGDLYKGMSRMLLPNVKRIGYTIEDVSKYFDGQTVLLVLQDGLTPADVSDDDRFQTEPPEPPTKEGDPVLYDLYQQSNKKIRKNS